MTIKKLILVFAVLYSVNSYGGVYKCTDANGHVLYSDTTCGTKEDRQAIDVSPTQKAPTQSSFFSVLTEKVRGFIKSFSNDSTTHSELPGSNTSVKQQMYQCDGRTHCSQMSSCDEATFFINHCPNTEMDGDTDGIPCESQWCQ
jgi:Excalibur calcium-binding domain/Domain of unknown function (DUF4124)